MTIISEILTEKIIFSLGWTFINSLWQGGFICIINWIILFMLSKQNARLRYIVSTISLFAILLFSVCSYLILNNYYDSNFLNSGFSDANGVNDTVQNKLYGLFILKFIPLDSSVYLEYFNNNLPLILTVWFWSVLFLSLKQLGGFALAQRLAHYKTRTPNISWQIKLEQLSKSLKISKAVKLMESAIVKVPTVIGYARPVILIPLGLLTAIPHDQLETIILHELAHIKRRDFLINILQNTMEVIFFFNPFVWLISSIVRSEREHCCDDIVINTSGNTISYIKALASVSTLETTKSNYALAVSMNQNHLLKRIDRIIKMKNYKNSYSRVFISSFILVLGIAFLGANAMNGYKTSLENSISAKDYQSVQAEKQIQEAKAQNMQQAKKADEEKMKKEQMIQELKKKYESTTDEDLKKKIEKKLQFLKEDNAAHASAAGESQKKEQMILELKKKLDSTTDEEQKKNIEKKIQYLQQSGASANANDEKLKEEQILIELEKKYKAATDEATKEKIKEKIQFIRENSSVHYKSASKNEEKEKLIMELKKKYESTTDEETKMKIKEKIHTLQESSNAQAYTESEEKEKQMKIKELKMKYEATTDEETKKKIEEKIKAIKEK